MKVIEILGGFFFYSITILLLIAIGRAYPLVGLAAAFILFIVWVIKQSAKKDKEDS